MNESLRGSALLQRTAADQWQHLPSGLTVIARPMPDYSAAHVILATHFGSIDQDFVMDGRARPSAFGHRSFFGAQDVRG